MDEAQALPCEAIVRTGDLLRLFTPENRPFWLTERSEGTPTHPGHVGG